MLKHWLTVTTKNYRSDHIKNPILPTGLWGLNGGRGELSLVGDAVFTFSFTCWSSLFDLSAAGVTSPLGSVTCSALSCSSLLCRLFTFWFCWASVPGAELFEARFPSSGSAVTGGPTGPPRVDSKQTSEENDFLPPDCRWLTAGSCTCLSWMTRWLNSRFGVTW